MYFTDVQHLIEVENTGEVVTTWYANPVWQKCKKRVSDRESALRLSRIMRDNRNIAMMLLAEFLNQQQYLFLLSLLNLEYADFEYEIIVDSVRIDSHIVTVDFLQKPSSLRYVNIQKTRKIRIAFMSLWDYSQKENRNGYMIDNPQIALLKAQAFEMLSGLSPDLKEFNKKLIAAISDDDNVDSSIAQLLAELDYSNIKANTTLIAVKRIAIQIMELVAEELANNWDNPRYSREVSEE